MIRAAAGSCTSNTHGRTAAVVALAWSVAACDVNRALDRVAEARRLASDLHVQFTRAADASNRAVMADTDGTSTAFAREADLATDAAQKDADLLVPLLRSLGFSKEE